MHALTYRTTVFLHDSTRDLVVDGVPPAAVQIEAHNNEAFDAITLRSEAVAQHFIDAGIAAGIVTERDLASGRVRVTVDRSAAYPESRGNVELETATDLYTFEPHDRQLASA